LGVGARLACLATMSAQSERLKQRTLQFGLDVLGLVDGFPRTTAGDLVGRQLAKAATSVAANDRATCAARSRAEFTAKLGLVFEEIDESEFWLDIAVRIGDVPESERLHSESVELRAIFGRSLGTVRANSQRTPVKSANPPSANPIAK
jgi:four helix bundle protein